MQVTVKYVNPPKAGKTLWTIKTQDDNLIFFDSKKFHFDQGGSYDITTMDQEWQGKKYSHVESVGAAKMTGDSVRGNSTASSGDRWYMPFVSNTVAHAIAAGYIKEPIDIGAWAEGAKMAATVLDTMTDDSPG